MRKPHLKNSFFDVLVKSTTGRVAEHNAVLKIFSDFAKAIEEFGNSSILAERLGLTEDQNFPLTADMPRVTCVLECGMLVNMGQEWRVKLRATRRNYEQILLRAYIPVHGYPVMLDLYEEDMIECTNETILRRRLTDFLKQPSTTDLIALFAAQ